MLPPEPLVLAARQAFPDAQVLLSGVPQTLGWFQVGWYGTNTSDERGSFAVVDPLGPLAAKVGDRVQVTYQGRNVNVYVIGSVTGLLADIGLARRPYMALSLLATDPITAQVAVLS
jgi:hypothetical protein